MNRTANPPMLPSKLFPLALCTSLAAASSGCGGGSSPSTGTSSTAVSTATTTGAGGGATTHAGGSGGAGGGATTHAGGSGGAGGETTTHAGGSGGAGGGCGRVLGPADAPRRMMVAHPYDANSAKSNVFEILALDAAGDISRPGTTIELGRAFGGEIVFTPDGKVAIAVQEDGSLGVVRFEDDGTPTVVHASFKGSFYAQTVTILPDGGHALVLDPNWRNNGGGLYRIAIGCDGSLKDEGQVAPSKLAGGLALLSGGRGVLAAADVLGSKAGQSAHLLDLQAPAPVLLAGADAFGDAEAIVSATAATHDGAFVLIGDNNQFSDAPNRVAVVGVGAGDLSAVQVLSPLEDPVALVTSPFDDAALVVSGFGNAFFALGYDPNSKSPFSMKGPITYMGKKPELPGAAVGLTRGPLQGRVFVAENVGIRRLAFHPGGAIEDLGKYSLGQGTEQITGAFGVSP